MPPYPKWSRDCNLTFHKSVSLLPYQIRGGAINGITRIQLATPHHWVCLVLKLKVIRYLNICQIYVWGFIVWWHLARQERLWSSLMNYRRCFDSCSLFCPSVAINLDSFWSSKHLIQRLSWTIQAFNFQSNVCANVCLLSAFIQLFGNDGRW